MAKLEIKNVIVYPNKPNGPQWHVTRWDKRYMFVGPMKGEYGDRPVRFLFHSDEYRDWTEAIMAVRKKWADMDPQRREHWYGVDGVYAKFDWSTAGT